MMLRTMPATSLARVSLRNLHSHSTSRGIAHLTTKNALSKSELPLQCTQNVRLRAIVAFRPFATSIQRYQEHPSGAPHPDLDRRLSREKFEDKLEGRPMESPPPNEVNATSSTHAVFSEVGVHQEQKDEDMMAEIKSDLKTIKETFALNEVPREAFLLGLAGVLPYLATSLTTVYLAWDINHADLTGQGFLLSGSTAQTVLQYIEPLQIGYGAVIISFLGAIHWGLEWAGFGGHHGFRRYAYGVVAPAVAWPTTFMPLEMALISQFAAFTALYYADSRATVNGWVPPWYSSYRFVLTFIVGTSIVLSLIGRGEIVDKLHRLPSPGDRVQKLKSVQMEEMEAEERYKQQKALDDEEEEEGEEAEEEEEAGDEE